MKKRHPNYRHVKIHRNYTVEDIADLFGIHKNTVRNWLKSGLVTIDTSRPMLIHGEVLADYLKIKRAKNKQKCKSGEMYCVRCRAPKSPALGMTEYKPTTATMGNLIAICPTCGSIMNRRASIAKLGQIRGEMDITIPQALQHIVDSNQPSVNSNLKRSNKS